MYFYCAVLNEGELVDYHMPWNPIVGMQILEYDRSFMASYFLDKFNGNLVISGRSVYPGRIWQPL